MEKLHIWGGRGRRRELLGSVPIGKPNATTDALTAIIEQSGQNDRALLITAWPPVYLPRFVPSAKNPRVLVENPEKEPLAVRGSAESALWKLKGRMAKVLVFERLPVRSPDALKAELDRLAREKQADRLKSVDELHLRLLDLLKAQPMSMTQARKALLALRPKLSRDNLDRDNFGELWEYMASAGHMISVGRHVFVHKPDFLVRSEPSINAPRVPAALDPNLPGLSEAERKARRRAIEALGANNNHNHNHEEEGA